MSFFQVEEVISVAIPTQKQQAADIADDDDGYDDLATCPRCGKRTLRMENGCHSCINPDCGLSKCDM